MRVILHKTFEKYFEKLPRKVRDGFIERKNLFIVDQFHPLLNNHKLQGKYTGCRSINITGDIRAIFYIENEVAIFMRIGSHPELYGQ